VAESTEETAKTLAMDVGRNPVWVWGKYVLAALVIAGGLWYWLSATTDQKKQRYVTAQATIDDFQVIVTATGTVEPTNLVEISSELSGTLARVNVDYNDVVEKGTILAQLDTSKLEAQLAVSKAALDSAIARVAMTRATLDETKEKFESGKQLEQRGITAHQTFVSLRAAYIRAQAELQSALADQALAEATLDLNQTELDKACICSPINGVVLDRAADTGQIVASALSAPILFTVAEDLTKMELQVDIDEADIGRTAVGNHAEFTVDAYDDKKFPATISEIRFAPETIDGVVTYKGILTIDNSDMLLRPGMTATADITVAEITGALIVPNAALRYAPPPDPSETVDDDRSGLLGMLIPQAPDRTERGNTKTIWVLRDGVAREIAITAGSSDGRVTQILTGDLAANDMVITDQIDG